MELRAPRGLPHRALCGEQGKTRRAAERGKEEQVPNQGEKRPPFPEFPSKVVLAEKGDFPLFFILLSVFFFKTVQDSQVHRFFSDHFFRFVDSWAQVSGLAHQSLGENWQAEVTGTGGEGEWAPGGEGLAGHWSLIGYLLILRCKEQGSHPSCLPMITFQ